MRKENVKAIFCADKHLQHKAPIWRSAEPDWYEAMKRPLMELKELQKRYECPILCAGDIFDNWNSPPELINFALEYMPFIYAIPGQHDLPNHNIDEIGKSAFWTLVKATQIEHSASLSNVASSELTIHSYPYGKVITPISIDSEFTQLLLAHQYVWIPDFDYQGAPVENRLDKMKHQLKGYDVAVFGDNHKGFLTTAGKTTVFNCGTLMRRKSDEVDYRPMVGLLLSDGKIKIHYMDISKDKYLTIKNDNMITKLDDLKISDFVKELEKLGSTGLDFEEAVNRYFEMNKVARKTRQILLKAIK